MMLNRMVPSLARTKVPFSGSMRARKSLLNGTPARDFVRKSALNPFQPKLPSRLCTTGVSKMAAGAPNKPVAYWLLGCSGLVASMVVLGGATRLTRSGLSMTDWRPTGRFPPMTQEEWETEFIKYKAFPEFKWNTSFMTVEEFKFIYMMEYSHRMWGRMLGLAYVGPLAYFAARGRLPHNLRKTAAVLLGLGVAQGGIGWWMVKSGLEETEEQKKLRREVRVSPYRLATHLTMALGTFSLLLWSGLGQLRGAPGNPALHGGLISPQSTASLSFSPESLTGLRKLRAGARGLGYIVAFTAFSGAFVAGNDAGRAFNSWPKMGDDWVPPDMLVLSPTWRNFFENTPTVQFDHRMLAYTTALTSVAVFARSRQAGVFDLLPQTTRNAAALVLGMTSAQITLGISALLHYVPTDLGVMHQGGAVMLLGTAVNLLHALQYAPPTPASTAAKGATAAAAAAVVTLSAHNQAGGEEEEVEAEK